MVWCAQIARAGRRILQQGRATIELGGGVSLIHPAADNFFWGTRTSDGLLVGKRKTLARARVLFLFFYFIYFFLCELSFFFLFFFSFSFAKCGFGCWLMECWVKIVLLVCDLSANILLLIAVDG